MKRAAIPLAILLTVLAGCSSTSDPQPEPAAEPVAAVAPVASGATVDACRGFATDEEVIEVRRLIGSQAVEYPVWTVSEAYLAVFFLRSAATPEVAGAVAEVFRTASEEAARQKALWVDTAEFDTEAFTTLIGTVNTACTLAGVDMKVEIF